MTCVNMQVKSRKSLIYVSTIQWQLKPGMAISPVPKSKKASTAVMVTVLLCPHTVQTRIALSG